MSEYWSFKCNTCEVECRESANHLEHVLLNILKNSENFKKIRESDKDGYIEFGIMNHSPSLIDFVIEHDGHDVVVQSEYRRFITKDGTKCERPFTFLK